MEVDARLRQEWRRAQKLQSIGALSSGLVHDINNVLTVIISMAELTLDEVPADSGAGGNLSELLDAADRARSLTRQLLSSSRPRSNDPVDITLDEVVGRVVPLLRRVIGDDIEVQMHLQPDPCRARIDPENIEHLILNLALNARDAMPDGGILRLEARTVTLEQAVWRNATRPLPPGRYCVLSVSDTGTGIPKALLLRIFEPFFSTKTASHGTGLGLSIGREVVEDAGGSIVVHSREGRGTTFEVYLPRSETRPARDPHAAPTTSTNDRARGSETLLLVEHDDHVRSVLVDNLQACGYRVLSARHGSHALELAWNEGPLDMVISSLRMPRIDGPHLVEQLRRHRPDLPVLYLAGHPSRRREVALAGRNTAILRKPFGPRALATEVRTLLDRTKGSANARD